jgi:2-polyprenyl-3-methyl-5-hydroxy-6-metoxy-1,4-benzoquinol methylase
MELLKYYRLNNHIFNSEENEYPNWDFLMKKISMFKQKGSLLDVGCSEGGFLFRAKKEGYVCAGNEINPNAIKKAEKKGIKVFAGDFQEIEFDSRFDVITMLRFFEHISEPNKCLEKASKLLKENGILVISVPNYSFGIALKRFSDVFHYEKLEKMEKSINVFRPPSHLYHYSHKTLSLMLYKHGYGIVGIFNTYPTYEKSDSKRTLLKKVNYLSSEAIYFLTFGKYKINHNILLIAKKKTDAF